MTGMRTSTLYFYVRFSHTTHQGRPCERNQKGEEKNKTRWLGFPKKTSQKKQSSYITGSGEGSWRGGIIRENQGRGDPRNARREKRKPVLRMDVRIFRLVCM